MPLPLPSPPALNGPDASPACSVSPGTYNHADVGPRCSDDRILRNIPHDVILTLPKGPYYQSRRRKTIWGAFLPRCLFDDYCLLVHLLATSLTMAVSDRVESSSALTIYKSPRRHDSNNTSSNNTGFRLHFLMPSSGNQQIASPLDSVIV